MAKIPHQRGEGQVRGWAELLEGTTMRFHCPAGHSQTEDMNRKALPLPKRVGAAGCRFYARWWSKERGGVTFLCKACRKTQLAQSRRV